MTDQQPSDTRTTAATPGRIARAVEAVKQWPKGVRYSIVVLLLAAPVIAVAIARPNLVAFAEGRSDLWLQDARHSGGPDSLPALTHPQGLDSAFARRLDSQLADVRASAAYHLAVAKGFFVMQYVTITLATIAAVIAGILLIPISWRGWQEAPPYLTAPFLVIAGIAILFVAFNQVYRQNDNVTSNSTAYFGYLAIEDEMLSYYPRRGQDSASVVAPAEFMSYVDRQAKALRSFAIGLDPSRIPTIIGVQEQVGVPNAP